MRIFETYVWEAWIKNQTLISWYVKYGSNNEAFKSW